HWRKSFVMKQIQAYLILQPSKTTGISLLTFKPLFSRVHFASLTPNASTDSQKKRIMVVDDEKDISMMFRSGLERNGFTVEVFNDPIEALSHFKPEYYDLLLLDVRMPGMTGFELFREIRKQDRKSRVCFISAFEIHQEELKKVLPDEDEKCVVKKPVSMKELVRIINEEIASKH
ncbi:MAG: response regulator, partial [Nitrososphaera sp.]